MTYVNPLIYRSAKWRRQVSGGRDCHLVCAFCQKRIARKAKYDKYVLSNINGYERAALAHTTCGLVPLSTLPPDTWIGRRVLYPVEQWDGKPNWDLEKGIPRDQGVVTRWDMDEREYGIRWEVYFRVDGCEDFCLHYRDIFLWTRP